MNIFSVLSREASQFGLELVEWMSGDKVRFKVEIDGTGQMRQTVTIIPDAAAVLRVERRCHYAFIEVDRGTEPQRTLAAKARAYAAYWQSGGFAQDFSLPRQMGFWVFFIAPTAKRDRRSSKEWLVSKGRRCYFVSRP